MTAPREEALVKFASSFDNRVRSNPMVRMGCLPQAHDLPELTVALFRAESGTQDNH